ncbi:hypothetical protein RF55_22116 [Lasius niger]|uniref:Uncharacterized protein n=1 Tax=Lasius niger TaxID=67767 RepID=A0A0J7MQ50_LASNI|nr:hypothetical protein RF55_22116 [Lasius niger]
MKLKTKQQEEATKKRKRSSESSDHNPNFVKEPRRSLQSRHVSLAGAMKPEIPSTQPAIEASLEGLETEKTGNLDLVEDTSTGVIANLGQELGVSATEVPPTDNVEEPIAGTSRSSSVCTSRINRPVRYRSVVKEVGTGPEGEILMRNVLETIGESDAFEGEADHHSEEKRR